MASLQRSSDWPAGFIGGTDAPAAPALFALCVTSAVLLLGSLRSAAAQTFTNAAGFTSEGSLRYEFSMSSDPTTNQTYPRGSALCQATGQLYVIVGGWGEAIRRANLSAGAPRPDTLTEAPYLVGFSDGTSAAAGFTDGYGTNARMSAIDGVVGCQLSFDSLCKYLYFAQGNSIRRVRMADSYLETIANIADLGGSGALTVSLDGLRVYKFNALALVSYTIATGAVAPVAGGPARGYADGIGTAAAFGEVARLLEVEPGVLLVGDIDGGSLRRVDVATGAVRTLAGSPPSAGIARTVVAGVGTSARMHSPTGMYFHAPSKTLYYSELIVNVVRKFNLRTLEVSGPIASLPVLQPNEAWVMSVACQPEQCAPGPKNLSTSFLIAFYWHNVTLT
eukprot:tig00000157_g9609.t1